MAMLSNCKKFLTGGLDSFRGHRYDFVHRVDTFGFVSGKDVRIESGNKKFGFAYQRTDFRTMNTLFEGLSWSEGATFVDLGCGKGLTLLTAAKYPFSRIVGVEYSSDLAAVAQKNVSQYRGYLPSRKSIAVVHGDASQFEFPITPLVCYFFNPFQPVIMEKVLDNLALSLGEFPRDIQLVFYSWYPKDLVRSKFEVLQVERLRYFHVYHLASPKAIDAGTATEGGVWKTIHAESDLA